MWFNNLIISEFDQGSISYIGDALKSKSIFRTTLAVFFNNYVMQTVLLTVGISLILPMIGILKTLLSFLLVGFVMVPSWIGMSGVYSYHSITMTLELEAYVFTCVCVAYFWGSVVDGVLNKDFGGGLKRGFLALMSGTLLAGIMLAFAGLYESVTLILARG